MAYEVQGTSIGPQMDPKRTSRRAPGPEYGSNGRERGPGAGPLDLHRLRRLHGEQFLGQNPAMAHALLLGILQERLDGRPVGSSPQGSISSPEMRRASTAAALHQAKGKRVAVRSRARARSRYFASGNAGYRSRASHGVAEIALHSRAGTHHGCHQQIVRPADFREGRGPPSVR